MSKKRKLYGLRLGISTEAQRIEYLLENIVYKADSKQEIHVFAHLALEKIKKISRNSEKIGLILKH